MKIQSARQPVFLILGDILTLVVSLWVTLLIRYTGLPTWSVFYAHLLPFSFIFLIWLVVYFIYDLYGNQTTIFQKKISTVIFNAHIINSIIALAFFYFIPYFSITPKTNLFIFLAVSFILIEWWRRQIVFYIWRGSEDTVLFACTGPEVDELINEIKNNSWYKIKVWQEGEDQSRLVGVPTVVINTHDRDNHDFVSFYNMLFSGARFVTLDSLYETMFGRVPISSISERWFLESISNQPKPFFEFFKRAMDIIVAVVLGGLSLVLYPFVFLAIKLDDGGPIFITQKRVGQNNSLVKTYKFRSMSKNVLDLNEGKDNKITKVGAFLRKTRIDELPQLWSVLKGDMSLIGPRPELPSGVEVYREQIPYYAIRNLIKPGLSGWAQIYGEHSHHTLGLEQTKNKLSYDLYYLKNRSGILDIKIALKTLRILLSRSGI